MLFGFVTSRRILLGFDVDLLLYCMSYLPFLIFKAAGTVVHTKKVKKKTPLRPATAEERFSKKYFSSLKCP